MENKFKKGDWLVCTYHYNDKYWPKGQIFQFSHYESGRYTVVELGRDSGRIRTENSRKAEWHEIPLEHRPNKEVYQIY